MSIRPRSARLGKPQRPDPALHQRAHLFIGWEDESNTAFRRRRAAQRTRDRAWWGIVGLGSILPLLMLARLIQAKCEGRW